jgi:hypothetical protein
MHMRRLLTTAGATLALTAMASPALAHFCAKTDFNERAVERAATSQAWLTADDWHHFLDHLAAEIPDLEEELGLDCDADALMDDLHGQVDTLAAGGTTLFKGPGLLAGGTLMNSKGNTPKGVSYIDFDGAIFEHCLPSDD